MTLIAYHIGTLEFDIKIQCMKVAKCTFDLVIGETILPLQPDSSIPEMILSEDFSQLNRTRNKVTPGVVGNEPRQDVVWIFY